MSPAIQRHRLPTWDDPDEAVYRRVHIDAAACDGCKLCTVICPANVLELVGAKGDKKSRVKVDQRGCISCNNCLAICAKQAIRATESYDFVGYYKQLDVGRFSPPRRF